MHKYTHVVALYQVLAYIEATNGNPECPEKYKIRTPVKFRGTVKLHGTNAGVACTEEALVAQSRTRNLAVDDDHHGFAKFVVAQTEAIRDLERKLRDQHGIAASTKLVLYGEWCGPGIEKKVAITGLPEKQLVLFGAKIVEGEESTYLDIIGPLNDAYKDASIHSVFDAGTWELEVDFSDPESRQKALDQATEWTQVVGTECPYAARFGVKGPGEGIVWLPLEEHWGKSDLYWKSKSDHHKVTKSDKAKPDLAPEVLAGINQFVEFAVTENRLDQGISVLQEQGLAVDIKAISHFLKWFGQDVKRECAVELESNELEWKTVSKAVTNKARNWFLAKVTAV
jgi:hypothetical protein